MMRPSSAIRPIWQGLSKIPAVRTSHSLARRLPTQSPVLSASLRGLNEKRSSTSALNVYKPLNTALIRYASSASSSSGSMGHNREPDPIESVKDEMRTIKSTFSLSSVPKESLYIGLAGVVPYMATSLTSVYLAWDINHSNLSGVSGWLMNPQQAQTILSFLEPIQIGWGAVIISFLGAIHWGLEFAGYGGHSMRRYAIGVAAPAVAWPTTFMPVESALITQFLAFTGLYFADAKATSRGLAPPWYSIYRFVLTFVVGASIVVTLIGRGQVINEHHARPSIGSNLAELKDHTAPHSLAAKPIEFEKALEEEKEKRDTGDKEEK